MDNSRILEEEMHIGQHSHCFECEDVLRDRIEKAEENVKWLNSCIDQWILEEKDWIEREEELTKEMELWKETVESFIRDIDAGLTIQKDSVKSYSGGYKGYWNAQDCREIAAQFIEWAEVIEAHNDPALNRSFKQNDQV